MPRRAKLALEVEIERGTIQDSGDYIVALVFGDLSLALYEFTVAIEPPVMPPRKLVVL
jgi:hypothetical protein